VRLLFWLLLLFALAVALSVAGNYNPGYALLVYPPWQIELSLTLLIVLLIAGFAAAYALTRLAIATLRLPESVRAWRRHKRAAEARKSLLDALGAWLEGRFAQAEKLAAGVLDSDDPPAVAALLAARAAQDIRAFERRDAWLARAEELDAGTILARRMLGAEGLLDQRRPDEALAKLAEVRAQSPQHAAAQRLELRALAMAGRWDELEARLPGADKSRLMEPAALREFAIRAREENLARRAALGDRALIEYWNGVPDELAREARVALAAARAFRTLGGEDMAAEVLENALRAEWDARLLRAYGDAADGDLLTRIRHAEAWLAEHPKDAALLLALGRLTGRQKLWGKARGYLEASLAIEATPEAHIALAELLESGGEKALACEHYHKALGLFREG
jgi:HemY protein